MKAGNLARALRNPETELESAFSREVMDAAKLRQHLARLRSLAIVLGRAHKFSARYFGLLDDEDLGATATEFFRAGVLRMPFQECYFEFDHCIPDQPHKILAAIVEERAPGKIGVTPFFHNPDADTWADYGLCLQTGFAEPPYERAELPVDLQWYGDRQQETEGNALRSAQYVVGLAMFLSTKHAHLREVAGALDKVNDRRLSQNRPPIYSHHVVELRPSDRESQVLGGSHASPRLHWRRGHLRHLPDNRVIPVQPCLVGLAERGLVTKEYLVPPPGKKGVH